MLPPIGQFRRYRVLELVNYITTELHKSFAPLFSPDAGDETKAFMKKNVEKKPWSCLHFTSRRVSRG